MKIREMITKARDRLFGKKEPEQEARKDVQKSAQRAQEGQNDERMVNLPQKAEKGQETAKNSAGREETFGEKAGDAMKDVIQKIIDAEEDERLQRQKKALESVAEQTGMTAEEIAEQWEFFKESMIETAERLAEAFRIAWDGAKSAIEMWMEAVNYAQLDEWQRKKLMMSNNERRRRGIPMVRRRAYLQAEKNRRRKARKK